MLWQSGSLLSLVLPFVLLVFLGLYLTGLFSGAEPEVALMRAGLAGVVLAILARLAVGILERAAVPDDEDGAGQHLDVAIGDAELDRGDTAGAAAPAHRVGEE